MTNRGGCVSLTHTFRPCPQEHLSRTNICLTVDFVLLLLEALALDPISWTLSERRIRCPRWQTRNGNGLGARSLTNSRQTRYGSSSTKARVLGRRRAISI